MAMAGEMVERTMTLEGEGEEAKARRRAFHTLLQIASRMDHLAMAGVDPGKIAGELGGMSAWIGAFSCQLVGVPLGSDLVPTGEVVLASLEVETHSERLFTVTAALPTEGIGGRFPDAASRSAALALGLVSLARMLLDRDRPTLPSGTDAERRHRQAEAQLSSWLGHAVEAYALTLEAGTPEPSFHGSGSVE